MVGDFTREMFATFFFTIIAGLTSDNPRDILIPALAIGLGCAILAESERAHMNPVVSMAIAICDHQMGWTGLFLRLLAQLIGCIFGGLLAVDGLRDVRLEFAVGTNSGVDRAVVFELFFSFILVLVVLRTRKFASGAFSHGFCYTMAVLAGNVVFSGNALINPAVAVGIMLGSNTYDSSTEESYLWIFLVAPIIGAFLAAIFFQFTEFLFEGDEDSEDESEDETTEFVRKEGVVRGTEYTPVQPQPVTRGNVQGTAYQPPVARENVRGATAQQPQPPAGDARGTYQRAVPEGVQQGRPAPQNVRQTEPQSNQAARGTYVPPSQAYQPQRPVTVGYSTGRQEI